MNCAIKTTQSDVQSIKDTALEMQKEVQALKDIAIRTENEVRSTKDLTNDIHRNLQLDSIRRWLAPPDPSTNHNRACRSREGTTGSWFIESEAFARWKETDALLWLHGKAGCGKTVLSSTIIAETIRECSNRSGAAVAYFYFDFNDSEKENPDKMIGSILIQLYRESSKTMDLLESLYSSCNGGQRQPDTDTLLMSLKEVIESFEETYLILDALDECSAREQLFESIKTIKEWGTSHLHMLLTSRQVEDIEEFLEPFMDSRDMIPIQSDLVDNDISSYIHERLQKDKGLKRWQNKPRLQEEIKKKLTEKADGMFRWAVCQLDVLQNCLNLSSLRKALESLPKTLDETYSRILCNIPEDQSEYAIKSLKWLAYSARPLKIEELAEVVVLNEAGPPWLDYDHRLLEPREILSICSSLVTTEENSNVSLDGEDLRTSIRFAHFSVKEYLVSERIQNQKAARYAIQEVPSINSITEGCLTYLLQFDQEITDVSAAFEDFPLARYAAAFWRSHLQTLGRETASVWTLVQRLCLDHQEAFSNSIRLFDPDSPLTTYDPKKSIGPPLYYSTSLPELVRLLLENEADVNAKGGRYGDVLQAASSQGHVQAVQLLLHYGADVNAQGGYFGYALHAASANGHKEIVQLLLAHGANANAQSESYRYRNALQAASRNDHVQIVQLLLDYKADVNAQGGSYGNALQAASLYGDEEPVRLLLDHGADVNAQGGPYGYALQAASACDYREMVQLLLDHGADVNAQGGIHGNALQAATKGGHVQVVQLLLDRGADLNAQSSQSTHR